MKNSEIIKKQMDNMLEKLPVLREGEDFSNYRNLANLLVTMYLDFSNKFQWGLEPISDQIDSGTLQHIYKDITLATKYVNDLKTIIKNEIIKNQQHADVLISDNRYKNYRDIVLTISQLMELEKYIVNDYEKLLKEYESYNKYR